ncbi:Hint domain-containing protein [Flavobacterium sp. U410]
MKKLMMYLLLLFGLFQITAQEIASINSEIVKIEDNHSPSFVYYRPTNVFTNPYLFSDNFIVEPIPVEYYTEKEKEIQKKLNEQEESIIAFSLNESFYEEQGIDNEEITPYTWKWVHLQVKETNGSYTNIHLRRPNSWFLENSATKAGDKIYISLPQIGIDGEIPIVKIYPNTLDTRFWDYYYDESHVKRPITGKIEHSANNVVDIKFNDSEKIISPTTNHLLWSADREGWVSVGELGIGEHITTKEGILTLTSKEPNEGWHVVYDLEIYRDHNFLAGEQYVLAHNCEVTLQRMMNKAEAELTKKKGLVPHIEGDGAKWVAISTKANKKAKFGKAANYTHRAEFTMKKGTLEWLKEKGINYEFLKGEKGAPDRIILKANEPGNFGIGKDLLPEFNKRIESVKIYEVKR